MTITSADLKQLADTTASARRSAAKAAEDAALLLTESPCGASTMHQRLVILARFTNCQRLALGCAQLERQLAA